jgi:hypothetical protein
VHGEDGNLLGIHIVGADLAPFAIEDETVGAVPGLDHIQTLLNLPSYLLVSQVGTEKDRFDRRRCAWPAPRCTWPGPGNSCSPARELCRWGLLRMAGATPPCRGYGAGHCRGTRFPFQQGERSPRQQLLDYLRHEQILLVLDNFEHLLDESELVQEILESAPAAKILATSRSRLNHTGESIFALEGLDSSRETMQVEASSAVKLFLHSARLRRRGYQPDEGDLVQIARICRLLQGMPLGILLATAWIDLLSPQEIAAQITGESCTRPRLIFKIRGLAVTTCDACRLTCCMNRHRC